jgi:predicted RNA-binding Zn-ribbon protein involved in translation (DUF1610 family)
MDRILVTKTVSEIESEWRVTVAARPGGSQRTPAGHLCIFGLAARGVNQNFQSPNVMWSQRFPVHLKSRLGNDIHRMILTIREPAIVATLDVIHRNWNGGSPGAVIVNTLPLRIPTCRHCGRIMTEESASRFRCPNPDCWHWENPEEGRCRLSFISRAAHF